MQYFTLPSEDLQLDENHRKTLRGSFIQLGDGVTHYELRGPVDAPVVILVPGLTIPLFYWDAFAERLHGHGLRTLAFSAYGRGFSDRVTTTYDEALFARQLQELLTALELPERCHVVGTSMGALMALNYLEKNPTAVSTLTLVGPAGLGRGNARQQKLLRSDRVATLIARRFGRRVLLGHLGHNVADPALAPILTTMIADTYRYRGSMYGFISTLQNFPLAHREPLYRSIGERHVPTLLMWGTKDDVTPITGLDAARELLAPKHTETIDCGHMAPFERPDQVADTVAAFIDDNRNRNTP